MGTATIVTSGTGTPPPDPTGWAATPPPRTDRAPHRAETSKTAEPASTARHRTDHTPRTTAHTHQRAHITLTLTSNGYATLHIGGVAHILHADTTQHARDAAIRFVTQTTGTGHSEALTIICVDADGVHQLTVPAVTHSDTVDEETHPLSRRALRALRDRARADGAHR